MTRSYRHKSHKQHKHSSKDAREHSDSEEDVNLKDRKGREEAVVRVSRDSASGEKRKLASQSHDGKDLFGPGNGDLSEEYVASKRRKDRVDAAVTDRWNGGEDERGGRLFGEKETKGEGTRPDSEKGPKSKSLVDSKSKSSRRHESVGERKEENAGLAEESEEAKKSSSSKVDSKRKSEKDLGRREVHQYKDAKDKERGAERDKKVQDVRCERSVDPVPVTGGEGSEVSRKQVSRSGAFEDEHPLKREVENTEWQIQDELRNPELEKELEKRIRRRRDGSGDKEKYQDDVGDGNDRQLSARDDRAKNGRYKDERSDRDKYKDDGYRDKYREDLDRDHRNRDDKHRDERSSRDQTSNRSDARNFRDENKIIENRHKKSKTQDSDRDGSPHFDDQGTIYKDSRGKKRSSDDNGNHGDLKTQSTKEHRFDVERKSSCSKVESLADRGRSQSRHVDADSVVSSGRRKSSPSSGAHFAKDQYRHSSKQAEPKYRDSMSEERARPNVTSSKELIGVSGVPERASEARSMVKSIQKDENYLAELSTERSPRSDAQASSMLLMEKSPSSTSIDRRYLNRTTVRQSLDVEEMGRRRSGSKEARDYSANEDRGSRELPLEKQAADEFSQDGDTVSVTSSFNRTSHLPKSSSSLLPPPPPFKTAVDSPSVLGSSEEDSRGKSSNRYRRSGDPNVGRGQGNAWKGVPNWPSPVANGFLPFQHGPPPGGFHAMMQQFPTPLFGVRPSMELNHTGVPYHIPDTERFSGHGRTFGWRNPMDEACPPLLHGWEGSNGVFGDESHMYVRPDWDQNRHLMSSRGWETSVEVWKGQNGGVNMELPAAAQKEDHLLCAPAEEIWTGQPGQRSRNERSRPGSQAESIEIKRSSGTPPTKDTTEAPVKTIQEKMPGPSKISNDDGARLCHVYISKVDISVDLAHPELYKQCMSLLDMEGNATDNDITKHVYPEEHIEAGVKFSSNTLSASLFPPVKDSIFQRAMALYKKQGAEMSFKLPVSSFPPSEPEKVPTTSGGKQEPVATTHGGKLEPVPTTDGENLEHVPTSNPEKAEEPVPTSNPEKAEEPVPISNQEKAEEPVPASNQEKDEELVPTSNHENAEEPVPTSDQGKVEEPDPIPVEEKPEEPDPTSVQEKEDPLTTSLKEKLEGTDDCSSLLEHASQGTINSPINEDINSASDSKGNHSANRAEEQEAFNDAVCGPLGSSDDFSEACEVLMPESIECRLVNLSRIHHSPENTH